MQTSPQTKAYLHLVLALGVAWFCHGRIVDLQRLENPSTNELIPTAHSLKLVSLGFDQLLADYYWLKFVIYIGDLELQKKEQLSKAEQFVELVTELDPNFISAYWFAAFTIGGDLKKPKRAAELLEFGMRKNPESWYLPFIAGINQYLYAGDEVAAAKYYRLAAKYPGAPEWLVRQAQILDAKSPRLIKQGNSWLNIFRSAENEAVKARARESATWLWVQVYKAAPNEAYRNRAREVLKELGVDVGLLKKTE